MIEKNQKTPTKTIVILAHPQIDGSSSHQFLIQSGELYTQVDYIDIAQEYRKHHTFYSEKELERLTKYDRIIFQFQLFWYQAPAILKIWLDQVFNYQMMRNDDHSFLAGKELGIVMIAGSKASGYVPGGRHGVTVSDLLTPYQAFASYWGMKWLPYFGMHQFHLKTESEKSRAMLNYVTYLNFGTVESFRDRQTQMLSILRSIKERNGQLLAEASPTFKALISTIENNQQLLTDIFQINKEG